MIRFWTLIIGMCLIAMIVRNMVGGGFDVREFQVTLACIGLLALALIVEGVCSVVEARHAVADGPDDDSRYGYIPAEPITTDQRDDRVRHGQDGTTAGAHPHPTPAFESRFERREEA